MARWYIIHAYSGFEGKVRDSIMAERKFMPGYVLAANRTPRLEIQGPVDGRSFSVNILASASPIGEAKNERLGISFGKVDDTNADMTAMA